VKTLKTVCLLVLAAVLASPLSAAVGYLKDGTQIVGTVVDATANDVVVHTTAGTRRIPTSKIARIDYAATGAAPAAPPPAPVGAAPAPSQSQWQRLQQSGFENSRQQVSAGLGFVAPLNGTDITSTDSGGGTASGANGGVGPLFDLQYLYFTHPRVAFGGSFDYFHRGGADRDGPFSSVSSTQLTELTTSGDSVVFQGVARYTFTDSGNVRPYVRGGLGFHHTWEKVDARPFSGFAWSDTGTDERRRVIDGSSTGLAGSAAVGLDFNYWGPESLGLELGWMGLSGATYGTTDFGSSLGLGSVSGPIHVFTFLARFSWGL